MKKAFTKILMLSGIFLGMSTTAHAQADTPMDEWSFSSSYVTIDNMRYQLDNTHLLAQWAYYNNYDKAPENLVVPSTVTYNGKTYTVVSTKGYGAYEQKNTKSVTLPETLRKLGESTFYPFPNVHEFTIPASVELVEGNLVGRDNVVVKFKSATPPTINGNLSYNNKIKVYVPEAGFEEYFQTDYLENCCVICDNLEASTITIDVVDNGELGYKVVGSRIPQITNYANVNKLVINAGTIDETDWYQMRQMKNLIEIDINGMSVTELPKNALYECWQIEKVTLPSTLETIKGYAFYATGIRDLVLPNSLTTITGGYNFYDCDSLQSITIPNGVTSLPTSCFDGSNNLKVVQLPNQLATMGSYCFSNCDIRDLVLPGTLTSVAYQSFYANRNMKSITFNEGTTTLDAYAFANCESLPTVTFPASLRSIGTYTFSSCTALADVAFNEGLETLEQGAFSSCTSLTVITLPSSLIFCLNRPFSSCTGITQINCMSLLPPTVRNNIPTGEVRNIEVHVPLWSFQEYMTKPGWLEYQPHIVIDETILPENIVINKDFSFLLSESQMKEDYNPNIRLLYNDEVIDDGFGHQKYERGNLTVSSYSKLNINDFSMYVSPYAKWSADYNLFYNKYDYDSRRTKWNPNSLIVKGEMRAQNQVYNLMLCNDIWQFISFPFDVQVSDIVPTDANTQWVIRSYDGEKRAAQAFDETWMNLTSEDVLEAGKGYIMKCYHNDYKNNASYNNPPVEFTVTPVQKSLTTQQLFSNADRSVALSEYTSEFEQNRSWNLIGNPYPCYFDTRYLETEAPFLVWDSYNGSYAAFSPMDDSYILNPGEAFFIQRPVQSDETLVFLRGGRQTYRNPNDLTVEGLSRLQRAAVNSNRQVVNLLLTQGEKSDRTRVVFNDEATMDYEIGRDAAKMMAMDASAPQLWTVNGNVQYAINERPLSTGSVELAIDCNGTATIALASDYEGLMLKDMLTGTCTELTEEGYTFTAQGKTTGRFYLQSKEATGIQSIEQTAGEADHYYNLQGQRVSKSLRGIVIKNGKKTFNK